MAGHRVREVMVIAAQEQFDHAARAEIDIIDSENAAGERPIDLLDDAHARFVGPHSVTRVFEI